MWNAAVRSVRDCRVTGKASEQKPTIHAIRRAIAGLLSHGHPKLEDVAATVGISPRTLQRRLAEAGLSHSMLVQQARMARACALLGRPKVKIHRIAIETGFTTASAFSRAFLSWTGMPPREFRQSL